MKWLSGGLAVWYSIGLIGWAYIKICWRVVLVVLLATLALNVVGVSDRAMIKVLAAATAPLAIFTLVIASPACFGSFFSVVGQVGLFLQRASTFNAEKARRIVAENVAVSRRICPASLRWLFGLKREVKL